VQTALIVSSGRTGTQFLARYFAGNFADVVAAHEPRPRAAVRLAANAWAAGAVPRALPLALLRRKARRIAALRGRLYVESNPFLWGAADLFDEAFGEPTIIHVVRDPRAQVRSSLNHGTSTGLKAMANRMVPFWYPPVRSLRSVGPSPDWMARAAGLWTLVNRRLRQAGARSRHYHVVRHEELFDEAHTGLRAICGLLGLEPPGPNAPVDPDVKSNTGTRSALAHWESWSDAECGLLDRICGPLMAEYGYGTEPAWLARVRRGTEIAPP